MKHDLPVPIPDWLSAFIGDYLDAAKRTFNIWCHNLLFWQHKVFSAKNQVPHSQ